jgi:hypothetical protein
MKNTNRNHIQIGLVTMGLAIQVSFTRHLTPALSPNCLGGEGEMCAASGELPVTGLTA